MKRFLQIAACAVFTLSQLDASYYDSYQESSMDGSSHQWAVSGSFLWWKAVEDNLPIAIVTDAISETESSSHVLNHNYKWDPGFRLGVGYEPCGCDWGFYAAWTHFNSKASRTFVSDDPTETIVPQWGSLLPFTSAATQLSSDWHLKLNWADFELNKLLCSGECFQFDVHAGLRAAWVDQKHHFDIANTVAVNSVHSKSDYSSVGVVAGLGARWMVGAGLNIHACAGGALLYGKQKSNFSETLLVDGITTSHDGSNNYNVSRAMTDVSLGIGWEGPICECWTLGLALDWEHHFLFNQNHFPRGSFSPSAHPRSGDLSMQGLTATAYLTF